MELLNAIGCEKWRFHTYAERARQRWLLSQMAKICDQKESRLDG